MDGSSSSTAIASVHSVVILAVSEHWTRTKVQKDAPQQVVGALLGKQSGLNVEFINCFEVRVTENNGQAVVDEEYFAAREALFKETFPDLDFLGWYITGDHTVAAESDLVLHRQAMKHNESAYLLKLDAGSPIVGDKLSLGVFESIVDPTDDSRIIFHPLPIKVVSDQGEQIGVDHVARFSTTGGNVESTASKQLTAQFGAIAMLIQGLTVARDYVKAVHDGKLPKNNAILRDIFKMCLKLQNMSPVGFRETEMEQMCNQKLMVLLTALTNVQNTMFNLVGRLNFINQERHHAAASSFVPHPSKRFPFSMNRML
ncbi:JAB1/Mov34/MPN/PAD-1 [Aphelenchoides avenae]|nr:JAB1/Mov34/MPN/PAD-1 [Aphelenchus avenae]